jgi:TusA-related sulfurtransferase
VALQVEGLFNIGLSGGEVGRHGRLTPSNSCAAMPSAILTVALSNPEFTHDITHIPLDQLSYKLMDKAQKRYWVKDGVQAYIYDIIGEKRDELFVEVTHEFALRKVETIVTHPQMYKKQPVAGFASFGIQYLNFEAEHPNPKAASSGHLSALWSTILAAIFNVPLSCIGSFAGFCLFWRHVFLVMISCADGL